MGGGEKIAFLIDKGFGICHKARRSAGVAELVDAPDSKSGEGDLVSVRFRSSVFKEHFKCEVLFFLAFEGSFLRRRRLGGGGGKKNEQNHRDAVLKRIGATWSCVDRIFFRLIAVI